MLLGLMALGLDYLWGKTGVLSFGHATFFGAGAYGAAIISTQIGMAPSYGAWLGLLGGILFAGLIAFIVGYFLIFGGVRGSYFTIVTLALGVISVHVVLTHWSVVNSPCHHIETLPTVRPGQNWMRLPGTDWASSPENTGLAAG